MIGLIFLIATPLLAQEATVIYSGLDNATSIYATSSFIFVVESGKNRILKLDHEGKLIETLGGLGTGDYQFDTPIDIDATNGLKIYVSDYRNNRIQIFDRRFQYLSTIKGENPFGTGRRIKPTQLVVNEFGELFFYDEASKSIHKHDENGNHVGSFEVRGGFEVGKITLRDDNLVLIDLKSLNTQFMSQNGVLGENYPSPVLPIDLVDYTRSQGYVFELDADRIEKSRDQ